MRYNMSWLLVFRTHVTDDHFEKKIFCDDGSTVVQAITFLFGRTMKHLCKNIEIVFQAVKIIDIFYLLLTHHSSVSGDDRVPN